ncbi:MAG: methyltransferase domain-containing protein [Proteobacteria bacterium]|nr:methyltransferase domain-containing protein [Pseudomonadota bacterium]
MADSFLDNSAIDGREFGRGSTAMLFGISFLTLLTELVLIRFIPSNIYLLSFYKNSVLLAVFLGLGTGFMLSNVKRNYIEYVPIATLVILVITIYFNDYLRIDLDYASKDETIWPEFWANTRAQGVPMLGVLVAFYLIIAFYFVPFGQETMRAMRGMRPLRAYSINIAGSLAGIVVFALLGWGWTKPVVWFALILLPLLYWSWRYSTRVTFWISVSASVLALFLLFSAHFGSELWSPYSKVRVYPFSTDTSAGFISTTNGNPQVGAMNFDMEYSGPEQQLNNESKSIYEIPYNIIDPKSVVVAGAGAGNEVEMALRNGATDVTAVELDPAFITVGKAFHPHRPFLDPRVTIEVNDARAFFHSTDKKFDLVVIGFLDSQYHLSHMSNIRTENFVYTYESIARTKEILSPNGLLQLNYNAPRHDMRLRLLSVIREVYGSNVVVFTPKEPVSGNVSFVAGPGLRAFDGDLSNMDGLPGLITHLPGAGLAEKPAPMEFNNAMPTDDWPFLYLSGKKIPREYVSMIILIPIISIAFIGAVGRAGLGFSPLFFLLGFGFMLLETKSITSLALLFGSTVTVVSIVIASILSAILLANLSIHLFKIERTLLPYLAILATIVILYFIPLDLLLPLGWKLKLLLSIFVIASPIFFSALVFGNTFSRSKRMDIDLGSNIFGAVTGGMFEYLSMVAGFNSLYILAGAAYLGALLLSKRADRSSV